MKVEVFYFEGCPHYAPTLELVREVMSDLGVTAQVESVEVTGADEAERYRFLGSPTVRVNGVDIDPSARSRTDYVFSCRVYGKTGTPPRELIKESLRAGSA